MAKAKKSTPKAQCSFDPEITGMTPVFRPTQLPPADYIPGDPFQVEHIFIIHGHNFGDISDPTNDIAIVDADARFTWTVTDAKTQDAHHIRVHATVTCIHPQHKRVTSTSGAGSGDLTVSVNTAPPPPTQGTGIKRGVGSTKNAQHTFTVFYLSA